MPQVTMDGWLTTAKVGRDDQRIKKNIKKALSDRRAKRGLPPAKTKTKKAAPKKAPPRRKKKEWSESEEEESEFEEENWEGSDEEEESDVEIPYEESSGEEDGDSSDNSESFLQKSKRKNPRMKEQMLKAAAKKKATNKKNGYAGKKVTSSEDEVSEAGSDDSDNGPFSKFKCSSKPTASARKKPSLMAESSDESDSNLKPSPHKKQKTKGATSKFFAGKKSSTLFSDEEDDTPVKTKSTKSAPNKSNKRVIDVDEEEDDKTPRKSLGDSSWAPDEDYEAPDGIFDDDDEALTLAIQESQKSAAKENKKRKLKKLGKNSKSKAKSNNMRKNPANDLLEDSDEEIEEPEEESVVELPSSSDDEDDEPEDDDHDAFHMDEDEREASQVLAAANDLSASVLRIMTSWVSGGGDEGDSKVSVPQGMIVDGAIAMTSMKRNPGKFKNNNSQHAWISNEVMQEVLPTVTLAEYQLLGVNWLAMLHSMTCKVQGKATNVNGILADEMGLGKTCQTIAFLAWLKYSRSKGSIKEVGEGVAKKGDDISDDDVSDAEADGDNEEEPIELDSTPVPKKKAKHAEVSVRTPAEEKSQVSMPHIIVVPASVVSNWEREFQTFAPHMSVIKYHGTQDEREELKSTLRNYLPKRWKKGTPMIDVILAPITYFQKETSEDRDFLRKFNFDYLICDEGHLLKNAKGLRYKNIDRFRTRHRLLLTGTPIQNSPQELMALLCFLMPLFKKRNTGFDGDDDDGGAGMLQHFVNLEGAQSDQETKQQAAYRKLKQLFAPFVLRRRKKDVLSKILPPKTIEVEFVNMEASARENYNSIIAAHLKAKKNKTKSATEHLFTSLRKAAHHPHLLRTRHTSPSEIKHLATYFRQYGAFQGEGATYEKVVKELEGFSNFDLHLMSLELCDEYPLRRKELERYMLTAEDLYASAKLARLQEILPGLISDGHRILIFSVWTMCLDLLGCMLEHMGIDYMRMDGSTAVADRQERIDKFNGDPSISCFLLSTNACGMGINLTSADTCIMHDIAVNPFVDLQAEDRCHRIGQTKPVKIIKLVAKDTVDSDIYDMQVRKLKMNAAIMESKEEKKEKDVILKKIVERHSEASGKGIDSYFGKENRAMNQVDLTEDDI